ncbi:MAG: iron-sulfur cluster biosynthesis family protein [Microbacteriaceae bacterium]
MITLTERAQNVVKAIAERAAEESAGLRIATNPDDGTELLLTVTPEPRAEDQVVESAGARVFLDPGAASVLDNRVLDAEVAENGAVTFAVA